MKTILVISLLGLFPGMAFAQNGNTDPWALSVWSRIETTLYTGDFSQGQRIAELALDTARERYGAESAAYADILYFLGITHQTQDNYTAMAASAAECVLVRKKIFGHSHSLVAQALSQLAQAQFRQGKYGEAEPLLIEARLILTTAGQNLSDEMAETCSTLASLYETQGFYLKAEPLHQEALRQETELHGDRRFAYSTYANNLAVFYSIINAFDRAVYYYDLALKNMETQVGKNHPDYMLSLKNKGLTLVSAGRYREAESILQETLKAANAIFPPGHPEIAYYLVALANLYEVTGRTGDAVRLREEALQLNKVHYGENHPRYQTSLLRFSILLSDLRYPRADTLLRETLRLMELNKREQTLNYANAEVQLAKNYHRQGRLAEARVLLEKAALLGEQINGKEGADYHWAFGLPLAQQNLLENRPDDALRLLDAARPALLATYGPDHERTITLENYFGRARQQQGNAAEALAHFQVAFAALRRTFSDNFTFLSAAERENFVRGFARRQTEFLAFTRAFPEDARVQGFAYDLTLFYKELLASYDRQLLAGWQNNPDTTYRQYVAVRQMIAAQWVLPVSQRRDLAELEKQKESLEKRLAGAAGNFAAPSLHGAGWQEVQRALRPGDLAVEWLRLPPARWNAGRDCYAALLLRPAPAAPELVLLPEVSRIDSLFAARGARGLQYATRTYTGMALFQAIWQPLERRLSGIQRIFYAPAGGLHLLNFDAIPTPEGALLGERYQFVRLGNTATLTESNFGTDLNNTRNALVLGGLDYETLAVRDEDVSTAATGTGKALWRGSNAAKEWQPLPQTRLEAEQLGILLQAKNIKTRVLTGSEGSERALKASCAAGAAPEILHIATHGFFFEKSAAAAGQWGGFTAAENPMFRSGLILAGANPAWRGDTSATYINGNDGVLTAEEVSLLPLRNTELVVLSACETGLGDIRDDEGVYGLQRAFRLAGARNIVMSLWRVPDAPTREFMEHFYASLLDGGDVRAAFAKAQRQMRKQYGNPYYWAGFILLE